MSRQISFKIPFFAYQCNEVLQYLTTVVFTIIQFRSEKWQKSGKFYRNIVHNTHLPRTNKRNVIASHSSVE